jgi:hypothetical protein
MEPEPELFKSSNWNRDLSKVEAGAVTFQKSEAEPEP